MPVTRTQAGVRTQATGKVVVAGRPILTTDRNTASPVTTPGVPDPPVPPPLPNAPVISAIVESGITPNAAIIGWTADQPTQGYVEYGTSNGGPYPLETVHDESFTYVTHSQPLSGLSPSTTYYYKIVSTNAAAQVTRSAQGDFTTDAAPGGGGGTYPDPTTLSYILPTAGSLPPLGVSQYDSVWDTYYTRVGPVAVRKQYSTHRYTNSDETRARLEGGRIIQTSDWSLLRTLSNEPGMPVWAYATAHRIWGVSGNSLVYVNTETNVRTTVRSFSGYDLVYSGFGDGNPSRKGAAADRYWALFARTTGGQWRLLSYDAQTDTIRGTRDFTGTPNACGMGVDGESIIVNWAGTSRGTTPNCVDLYDATAGGGTLSHMRRLNAVGDHGDCGEDADGNPIYVTSYNGVGTNPNGPANVYSFRMDQSTSSQDVGRLFPQTMGGKPVGTQFQQGHVSMQAEDRPGYAYCAPLGDYILLPAYGGPNIPGRGQIVAVPTDGSAFAAGSGVEVYGFHRSDYAYDGNPPGVTSDQRYEREPQPVPNKAGDIVFYNSKNAITNTMPAVYVYAASKASLS